MQACSHTVPSSPHAGIVAQAGLQGSHPAGPTTALLGTDDDSMLWEPKHSMGTHAFQA